MNRPNLKIFNFKQIGMEEKDTLMALFSEEEINRVVWNNDNIKKFGKNKSRSVDH